MANIPPINSSNPQFDTSQHQTPDQFHPIPPQQTLIDPNTNCSTIHHHDNDLVNIDDPNIPYTFVIDPFSPINSPSFSCSYHRHHNRQINSNPCSSCSSESESESNSESDGPDSSIYPDCLYGHDEQYDQMDFITDLFESRVEFESSAVNSVNLNDTEELGLGLRVARIESESDTEDDNLDLERNPVEERDGLSSVIDRIEEISVSSDISSDGDANVGVLEWEILLAVNNLERDLEFATEGFVYTPEFDTLIGQFVETVRALRGSPPAAKSFIDNLPIVTLENDTVICAVCKDEILMEERVTQLPCKHHYHGECIVPWLSIRNTCPVCRFELPTDDVEYERSKNGVNDDELRVGNYENLLLENSLDCQTPLPS